MRRLLLALALALPTAAPAQAPSPTDSPSPSPSQPPAEDDRLQKVRERRLALEREVARLRGEEKSLLGDVERLEVEVRLRGEQLRETQLLLQRTNAQLDVTLRKAKELDKTLAAEKPVLAARARELYKLGEVSYLRILLSIDRPSDIFRGYRFVAALARRDKERFATFRADLNALTSTRTELERKTQDALTLRQSLEKARLAQDADRRRKTELLTEIVEKKETNAAYVRELETVESRLRDLLQGLETGDVAVPLSAFKGSLPWPVAGKVRAPFGKHRHPKFDTYTIQNGIEIGAPLETPVAAVYEGVVVFVDRFKGYGLMVVVDHGGKHHTLYAHLAEASVQVGQKVAAGESLGTTGTGVDGAGLYFEVRFQGRPEDPAEWLKKEDR
ncbi:MAG: murein hydrolase activator EnvC family protein [Vicinamibacteria bacterium]